MVYCGPPSKGCSSCRDRKIRCDLKEPSCGQCDKRRQSCPGYRNMVDLMFRDESSHVIKKVQAKQQRRRAAAAAAAAAGATTSGSASSGSSVSAISSSSSSSSAASVAASPATKAIKTLPGSAGSGALVPLLPTTLLPTLQEQGTAYFFSRYVAGESNALHQRFDFIYDVWKPNTMPSSQSEIITASMTAVGLIGLAQLTHSERMVSNALNTYGTALRQINAALRNPTEAAKDTTMLSVLILGVFEMIVCPNTKTMQAWDKHINGAIMLANLRGPSQLRTAVGIRMFNMLCQSVMIACIQKHAPVPPELVAFQNELLSGVEAMTHGFSRVLLTRPVFMMLQLRHDLHENLVEGLDAQLARMQAIARECQGAIMSFPSGSIYRELHIMRPHPAVFQGRCHVYRNPAIASVWNLFRLSYICVLESILAAIQRQWPDAGEGGEPVPLAYRTCYYQTCRQLEKAVDDIVCSVPQSIGLLRSISPYYDTLDTPVVLAALPTTEVLQRGTSGPVGSGGSGRPRAPPSPPPPKPEDIVWDDSGPSIENPTRGRTEDEDRERMLLLASSSNGLVWPLFSVGTSTICPPPLKTYIVERLTALHEEMGVIPAGRLAAIVHSRALIKSPWHNVWRNEALDGEAVVGPEAPAKDDKAGVATK